MASNQYDVDKMLQAAEKGKSPSTYGSQKGGVYGIGSTMSPQPAQVPMPPPKSNAPRGAGFTKLPANIGLMTQKEAAKVFSGNPIKKAGKPVDPASYLPYRKPAIEGGEGPHAV